ncbi:MAG: hypothetical protein JO266_20530 [Acidobacteria bacterium]|nr:hypothetical protein [Acidobacteriota bacterium]
MLFHRQPQGKKGVATDTVGPHSDKFWWEFHTAAMTFGLRIGYSRDDVEVAFRRLALKAHPDVGGTLEAFQLLVRQRDLLLDQVVAKRL